MSDRPKLFSPRPGSRGMDDLQYAAYCGDADAVRHFLVEGADAAAVDDFGYTALHWCVRMAGAGGGERDEVIRLLLAAGADVNHRDGAGKSVLTSAIEATAPDEMLSQLRAAGAM
jgi:ankyrin repeat protein